MAEKDLSMRNAQKLVGTLFFAVLFLMSSVSFVSALGITPGRTTLSFASGLEKEVSFSVLNSEHKDMRVSFAVRGELAPYIVFEEQSSVFSSEDSSKSFTYTVQLPQSFATPGRHDGEILVLESPLSGDEETTTVGGTVAVASQLQVNVPYPYKYIDAEVNVLEEGGKVKFVLPVVSRGKLDVVSLRATIDIYDGVHEKIASVVTTSEQLLALERTELVGVWDAAVNPGRYEAVATIRYDDGVTSVVKDFNVGEQFLDVLEVKVPNFALGSIAKFDALVENKWSSALREVYLNILVYNSEGEVMADFKSPTYDIGALARSNLIAYWDTAGVREGTYDGTLYLRYGEKATEKKIQLKISNDALEVVGLTGNVISGGGGGLNLTAILVLVVGILVVANIIWFVLIRRMLKKRGK